MRIKIKINSDSSVEKISKISEDYLEISVKEPPVNNMADRKVIELVKNYFLFSKNVRIISGHHSRNKILSAE